MKTISFATCSRLPSLVDDDRLVIEPLRARGVSVEPLVWDADPCPSDGRPVVVRSCWDYHLKPRGFLDWTRRLAGPGVRLWNPASVVEWNLEKTYLRDLQGSGVTIPDTVWVGRHDDVRLSSVLRARNWSRAVVKPSISATAWRTFVTGPLPSPADEQAFDEMLLGSDALVQEFVPEVQSVGEWSLLFFARQFSHAVLKRPKEADFRVQEEFGGTAMACEPPAALCDDARRVVDLVRGPLLFARVDGVEVDGRLVLMELELIEPCLFLGADCRAPARFADAIVSLCWIDRLSEEPDVHHALRSR